MDSSFDASASLGTLLAHPQTSETSLHDFPEEDREFGGADGTVSGFRGDETLGTLLGFSQQTLDEDGGNENERGDRPELENFDEGEELEEELEDEGEKSQRDTLDMLTETGYEMNENDLDQLLSSNTGLPCLFLFFVKLSGSGNGERKRKDTIEQLTDSGYKYREEDVDRLIQQNSPPDSSDSVPQLPSRTQQDYSLSSDQVTSRTDASSPYEQPTSSTNATNLSSTPSTRSIHPTLSRQETGEGVYYSKNPDGSISLPFLPGENAKGRDTIVGYMEDKYSSQPSSSNSGNDGNQGKEDRVQLLSGEEQGQTGDLFQVWRPPFP